MKTVIVGGGVAGPAVALALGQVGIDSVVLEARPEHAATAGSYLTLAPNGVHAVADLGLRDELCERAFPTRRNRLVSSRRRLLGEVTPGEPLPDGTTAQTLKRAQLADLLATAAVRRGIEVRYGARVVATETGASAVTVDLQDGSRISGDLLVGADGVRSRTRATVDPSAPEARYVGLANFGGITRRTALAATLPAEAWQMTFGKRAFFGAHPTPDGDVVWFANVPRPPISRSERAATTHEEWRELLVDLFSVDDGPAAELVRTGELELAGDSTYDLPHVPAWHRGRSVLVGDAAHAPSPSSGQGAALALEDAIELARCLRDRESVGEAFRAYEEIRRRRVERVVAAGARSSSAKIPGPVGRVVRDAALRMVFRYLVTDRSVAWMSDHRVHLGEPVG